MARKQKILLLTPPFVQLNTPYPATTQLVGWLASLGVDATQRDLSIEVALDVLRACGEQPLTDEVLAFLQGKDPDNAETLAEPGYLPEGPAFDSLTPDGTDLTRDEVLGGDPQERAKVLCSLYLDDLAAAIRDQVDPDFGFSRYAEHLGAAVPDFGALLKRLRRRSLVDKLLEARVARALKEVKPTIVGVTCPFPGTLVGAFRIARTVRTLAPHVKLVLGGGYVNTELRSMHEPRVARFFDIVMYDEGYAPWAALVGAGSVSETAETVGTAGTKKPRPTCDIPAFVKPSYHGLDLSQYISLAETTNPMHRLWSDGRWLKIQLARGCYWHKCAFCDVTLDYIKCFQMPTATTIVDAMQALADETGETGFHFTDEAIPPKLAQDISREILRRRFSCTWWGNVRFDASYTPALARLMARAGCIAVTGGLECATDRLLKLMNKGITLASARIALRNFSDAGILVHAYLMYGFPTQTEKEAHAALRYVRDRFREGVIQSAFFHRFALTVHSPIARAPSRFGIAIPQSHTLSTEQSNNPNNRTIEQSNNRTIRTIEQSPHSPTRFALNEIPYNEPGAPDWERLGRGLKLALYNYMLGLGLDLPVRSWFISRGTSR